MKGQPSSCVYPQRAFVPGKVRITADNIAVPLFASEDGEATEACCADTLPLQSPEGRCDVTRATTRPASHLLLDWRGRNCLKSFIRSLQDLWCFRAFYYCLMVESKQGGWKAHCMVNIFWRALWRAGVWRFSVKSVGNLTGSYLDFHQVCFFLLPGMLCWWVPIWRKVWRRALLRAKTPCLSKV